MLWRRRHDRHTEPLFALPQLFILVSSGEKAGRSCQRSLSRLCGRIAAVSGMSLKRRLAGKTRNSNRHAGRAIQAAWADVGRMTSEVMQSPPVPAAPYPRKRDQRFQWQWPDTRGRWTTRARPVRFPPDAKKPGVNAKATRAAKPPAPLDAPGSQRQNPRSQATPCAGKMSNPRE